MAPVHLIVAAEPILTGATDNKDPSFSSDCHQPTKLLPERLDDVGKVSSSSHVTLATKCQFSSLAQIQDLGHSACGSISKEDSESLGININTQFQDFGHSSTVVSPFNSSSENYASPGINLPQPNASDINNSSSNTGFCRPQGSKAGSDTGLNVSSASVVPSTTLHESGIPETHNLLSLAKNSIRLDKLEEELQYYESPEASEILSGFRDGFPLSYTGPRVQTDASNLRSARRNPEIVRQKIQAEVSAGRVAGPFVNRPFNNLRISPLGLVPKKIPGEFRLIHHLSYPAGNSLNDFIDPALCTVQYTSFDEAVHMVQDLGQGCLLGKADIKSAFRLLAVSPHDFDQLGFKFDEKFYFDKAMPFGCSKSCNTWEKFARFLEFCVSRHSNRGALLHYLDDFLFGGKKGTDDCKHIMDIFRVTMDRLGVPIASEKTEGPVTILCFLGLELDSEEMVIRIPLPKVLEIIERIQSILSKDKVTLKAMQSLIGVLNFACRAIVPGRPFCRRLINSICGLTQPFHHLRITKGIRQDLQLWLTFFQDFNGISVFHDRFWVSNEDVQLFTDSAAGEGLGFGVYFAGKWTYGVWPQTWFALGITNDITVLELFPMLVALHIWGKELRNKKICFRSDNLAVVHIVNTMTSKSDRVMVILRAFTLLCLRFNVVARSTHVSGVFNTLADALSRLQIQKFHKLAPEAEPMPEPIPDHLWKLFSPV